MAAITRFNELEYLDTEADMATYLEVALSEEGMAGFLDAAADVMKVRALLQLSRDTGIAYRELCRVLSQQADPGPDAIERIREALTAPVPMPAHAGA
jgi:probable addiction module antidote protein